MVGAYFFLHYLRALPDFGPLKAHQVHVHSTVYSDNDELIAEFLMDNRIPVAYENIPKQLIQAFLAAEDAEFFRHSGVNSKSILRATLKNLVAGRIVQGGSTITQQVVKTFFLTPKRSFFRKLKEAAFAFGLERNLTKEEILFLYLNNIYLGNGAYGIEAASESYFNKRVGQLKLAEMAMIAGLAKAPSRYSPLNDFEKAKERQAYVLARMLHLGFISREDQEQALQEPLILQPKENACFSKAPYFTEWIRQQVERKYGKERVYQEGLKIYTTLDLSFQKAAQKALDTGLRELDKRKGFRGPIRTVTGKELKNLLNRKRGALLPLSSDQILEAVVLSKDDSKGLYWIWVEGRIGGLPYSEMRWALPMKKAAVSHSDTARSASDVLKTGDVVHVKANHPSPKVHFPVFRLEQEPIVQGAVLCVDPHTGYVKAMVGGRNFEKSQFNRVVDSKRQPGSAFKPFIYAAALEKGYTPLTVLMDSHVEYFNDEEGTSWAPENYDKKFKGPISFQDALAYSRNAATVKLLEKIGIGNALRFIKRSGIESPIKRNLSIALGTSEISMLELTSAFGVFANRGERVTPVFIRKIVTLNGEILEENRPHFESEEDDLEGEWKEKQVPVRRESILPPQDALLMTRLLQGVVEYGTGQKAKALGRPVAGKTGTSSGFADAWFIGYTPSLLASVWVGFDDKTSLGENETGARAALPIWVSFMRQALRNGPIEHFKAPDEIALVKASIDFEETASDDLADAAQPSEAVLKRLDQFQ